MPRILYILPTQGAIQGGHKIIVRHVEALRRLGFDAYCFQGRDQTPPNWLDHSAPFLQSPPINADDVVVVPDDGPEPLQWLAAASFRTVVLTQNPYYCAMLGFASLDLFPTERFPRFIAVSEELGATIRRAYPAADIDIVPCFADERIFKPAAKTFSVAFAPKKRALEARIIRELFRKLHPRHADLTWVALDRMTEAQVALMLGEAGLFLSLSRLESVGMTTLEAMACGCLCAGFTGIGGDQYASPQNGFWVREDDCVAAADALAKAADLLREGNGAPYLAQAAQAATLWSYQRFVQALEQTWMRLAPDARCA